MLCWRRKNQNKITKCYVSQIQMEVEGFSSEEQGNRREIWPIIWRSCRRGNAGACMQIASLFLVIKQVESRHYQNEIQRWFETDWCHCWNTLSEIRPYINLPYHRNQVRFLWASAADLSPWWPISHRGISSDAFWYLTIYFSLKNVDTKRYENIFL